MYYASIGMLSIAVLVIINFDALINFHLGKDLVAKIRYRHFLYGAMVYLISDILWGILYGQRWVLPTFIDTTIYFLSMVVSVVLWTRFVVAYLENQGMFGKLLIYSGWIIAAYEVIVLTINLFTPIVFGFDANKEYVPGRSRYVTLFIQMFLFLVTAVYTLIIASKSEGSARRHHVAVALSGIAMTIFIALQSLYPLLPFYAVGCLLATCTIHSFVYRDERTEFNSAIDSTRNLAYRDPLTGVKNKLAYLEKLKDIEIRMQTKTLKEFGVAVFDLNNLKKVNDTLGHEAGDQYIKDACMFICLHFKYSPVFRIGGDEFVVILEGRDYEEREFLLESFEADIDKSQADGLVVIASGLSIFDPKGDDSYNDVFMRADRKMYERKGFLKAREAGNA